MDLVRASFIALICLLVLYLTTKAIFKAYFEARKRFIYQLIEKAKELKHGKE